MAQGKKAPKEVDVVDHVSGQARTLGEIGSNQPVEKVTPNDFCADALELEKFMNEEITVIVHSTMIEGELDIICPQVNGSNQPIVRDAPSVIKRKYVEVLARSLITKPLQRQRDLNDPSSLVMINQSKPSYPFTVVKDANRKGRPWLKSVIDSAHAEASR